MQERSIAGETASGPIDQRIAQDGVFGRALVKWSVSAKHQLRASITPQYTTRGDGDRTVSNQPAVQHDQLVLVSGGEYELSLFGQRLSNVLFVKDYLYDTGSEGAAPGPSTVSARVRHHSLGVGDALRVRIAPFLYIKASSLPVLELARAAALPRAGSTYALEPYYYARWVHEYLRGWESLGVSERST